MSSDDVATLSREHATVGESIATDRSELVELAHRVIERRSVQTLFQPLVHLPTRDVVGFEALTRGPEGTALESPLALLDAARDAGRLAELDWLCAASACAAAQEAQLHPSMSIFLNFEPVTLFTPCPEDLVQLARQAQDRLRVFVETKERGLLEDPARVFTGLCQVREIGWGVAIDDPLASPESLGLFPLISPDVIKLDLAAVRERPEMIGVMSDGARLYSEQTGAAILAEGIEMPEDLHWARAAGAKFGQGWQLGRPAPLSGANAVPRDVVPLRQRPVPEFDATPFEIVTQRLAPTIAEGRFLDPVAAYLARQSCAGGPPAPLLVSLDARHDLSDSDRRELDELIEHAAFTVLMGPDRGEIASSRSLLRIHRSGDPLLADWSVIVLGTHYAGAFVARTLDDGLSHLDRRYEYVITHDRDLVLAAAQGFVHAAAARRRSR